MVRVLIADDDKAILDLLSIYMKNEGYEVLLANDGQEACDLIDKNPDIDIALLDIMMPHKTGLEVLEHMRSHNIDTPTIMISANQAQSDKIGGLLAGADDYVTKPFEALEVVLRVKSLLRRQGVTNQTRGQAAKKEVQTEIDLGPIMIDKRSHTVQTAAGDEIKLTALEFDILYLLAGSPGEVFSADDILESVWSDTQNASSKTVMVHVSNLRNKIEEATKGDKVIQTVWGVGYKIEV